MTVRIDKNQFFNEVVMKIFSGFDPNLPSTGTKRASSSKVSNNLKEKSNPKVIRNNDVKIDLSPSEIREKVKLNQAKKNEMKKEPIPTPVNLSDIKEIAEPTVSLNDPSNTNTVEKLKDVLKSGSLNFSDKTKQVLGDILKDR